MITKPPIVDQATWDSYPPAVQDRIARLHRAIDLEFAHAPLRAFEYSAKSVEQVRVKKYGTPVWVVRGSPSYMPGECSCLRKVKGAFVRYLPGTLCEVRLEEDDLLAVTPPGLWVRRRMGLLNSILGAVSGTGGHLFNAKCGRRLYKADYIVEWAAAKRASMDLTRSLARLRRAQR